MKQDEQLQKPNLSEQKHGGVKTSYRKNLFSPKPNRNFQLQQKCNILKSFSRFDVKNKCIFLIALHYMLQILLKTLKLYCYLSDQNLIILSGTIQTTMLTTKEKFLVQEWSFSVTINYFTIQISIFVLINLLFSKYLP